jgi:hypothetical protein
MAVTAPKKVTEKQAQQLAEVLVRTKFEPQARDFQPIEWLEDGWRIEYLNGNKPFELKFIADESLFVKGPIDAANPTEEEIQDAKSADFAEAEIPGFDLMALIEYASSGQDQDWQGAIDQLILDSEDLQEFTEGLPGVYAEIPADALAEAMQYAMSEANRAGFLS